MGVFYNDTSNLSTSYQHIIILRIADKKIFLKPKTEAQPRLRSGRERVEE